MSAKRGEPIEIDTRTMGELALKLHTAERSALDLSPAAFARRLASRQKNRRAMMAWIAAELVEGIDYGRFHRRWPRGKNHPECREGERCEVPWHFTKKSLQKAGAEKISAMLGLVPTWPALADYERMALRREGIVDIVLRCLLLRDGDVVGEGVGARVVRDFEDLNKALKMAKKSAHIDAVLVTAGLSEVFTQDLDEYRAGEQGDLVDAIELCPVGPYRGRALVQLPDAGLADLLELSDSAELRERVRAIQAERELAPAGEPDDPAAPNDPTLPECAEMLRGCLSKADLTDTWARIPERHQGKLAAFHDRLEKELP